jgi:hypothetical protein
MNRDEANTAANADGARRSVNSRARPTSKPLPFCRQKRREMIRAGDSIVIDPAHRKGPPARRRQRQFRFRYTVKVTSTRESGRTIPCMPKPSHPDFPLGHIKFERLAGTIFHSCAVSPW